MEVHSITEMPQRGWSNGLAGQVRALEQGQTIFIPCREGESSRQTYTRINRSVYRNGGQIRQATNGCWIYKQ